MPGAHNPAGIVQSASRRRALLEVARRFDLRIIEDAANELLVHDSPPPLLLAAPVVAVFALPYAPDCVLRASLGLRCPGCGLGHAFAALLAARPLDALRHYPALAVLVPAYGLLLTWAAASALERRLRWVARLGAVSGIASACAVVGTWVLRTSGF